MTGFCNIQGSDVAVDMIPAIQLGDILCRLQGLDEVPRLRTNRLPPNCLLRMRSDCSSFVLNEVQGLRASKPFPSSNLEAVVPKLQRVLQVYKTQWLTSSTSQSIVHSHWS